MKITSKTLRKMRADEGNWVFNLTNNSVEDLAVNFYLRRRCVHQLQVPPPLSYGVKKPCIFSKNQTREMAGKAPLL